MDDSSTDGAVYSPFQLAIARYATYALFLAVSTLAGNFVAVALLTVTMESFRLATSPASVGLIPIAAVVGAVMGLVVGISRINYLRELLDADLDTDKRQSEDEIREASDDASTTEDAGD